MSQCSLILNIEIYETKFRQSKILLSSTWLANMPCIFVAVQILEKPLFLAINPPFLPHFHTKIPENHFMSFYDTP